MKTTQMFLKCIPCGAVMAFGAPSGESSMTHNAGCAFVKADNEGHAIEWVKSFGPPVDILQAKGEPS